MALTKSKKIVKAHGLTHLSFGVAANAVCFAGGLAIIASGFARAGRLGQGADNVAKAADAATYRAVGVFTHDVTGGAANGDKKATVETGPWRFKNSAAGDAITAADIGRACYIIDDETVAKTNPNATRAVAGAVLAIEDDGQVLVDVSPTISAALTA